MELTFERHYPHPIERVWEALTTSSGLERWLMKNDFQAELGRDCEFRFCAPDSGVESVVRVRVEALEPPRFMKWRWRNEGQSSDTTVTFELEDTGNGTLLRLRHEGVVTPDIADALDKGWPTKLDQLGELLSSPGAGIG